MTKLPLQTLALCLTALLLVLPHPAASAAPRTIGADDLPTVAEAGRAVPTLLRGTRKINPSARAYRAPASCRDRVRKVRAASGREATYVGRDPIDSHKVLVNTARMQTKRQARAIVRGWQRLLVVCPKVATPQVRARFKSYRMPRMGQQQATIAMRLRSGRINLNVVRSGKVVTTVLIFPSMRYTRRPQVVAMTRTAVRAWRD